MRSHLIYLGGDVIKTYGPLRLFPVKKYQPPETIKWLEIKGPLEIRAASIEEPLTELLLVYHELSHPVKGYEKPGGLGESEDCLELSIRKGHVKTGKFYHRFLHVDEDSPQGRWIKGFRYTNQDYDKHLLEFIEILEKK